VKSEKSAFGRDYLSEKRKVKSEKSAFGEDDLSEK